jgi:hypothetical protein
MPDPVTQPAPLEDYGGREISGKWIVLGMFVFALTIGGTLLGYWYLHRAPFLPLQQAIAAEYEGSRPLVEGGQRKMHRDTPRQLRVVMEVAFDPNAAANRGAVDRIVDRLLELAEQHHGLGPYDEFEAHVFLQERERELHEHRVVVDLATGRREHHDE